MAMTDAQGGALNEEDHDPETGELLPPTDLDDGLADDPAGGEEDAGDEGASGPTAEDYAAGPAEDPLSLETMSGDIRDALLSRFRMAKKPWEMMVEHERRELVEGFAMAARDLVRKCVRLVTTHDFPRAVVMLGDVKIISGDKSRIEGKIACPNIAENREVLGEHVGDMVMMLMVDSDRFMAERREIEIPPDQPDLPLEGEAEDVTPEDTETF